MTEYEAGLPVEVAFPPEEARSLAEAFAEAGLAPVPRRRDREVRARHVLLQRRRRGALAGRGPPADPEPEGRHLRPRPGDERRGVTDALVEAIESGAYDFIVANYANPDMVGHTGRLGRDDRGARACSTPASPGSSPRSRPSRPAIRPAPAPLLAITADHGNADELRDADGHAVTAHSLNPVPFVLVGRAAAGLRLARRGPRRRRADAPRVRRAAALGRA